MSGKYKHPSYLLRIPQELKDSLQLRAMQHNQSLNAEIIARLKDSLLADVCNSGDTTLDEGKLFFSDMITQSKELLREIKVQREQLEAEKAALAKLKPAQP